MGAETRGYSPWPRSVLLGKTELFSSLLSACVEKQQGTLGIYG